MRCARPATRALRGVRWLSWQRAAPSVWTYGVELDQRPQTIFGRHACYVPPKTLYYELPSGQIPEVAVAGRSNVGKSTLVGALLGLVPVGALFERGALSRVGLRRGGGGAQSGHTPQSRRKE